MSNSNELTEEAQNQENAFESATRAHITNSEIDAHEKHAAYLDTNNAEIFTQRARPYYSSLEFTEPNWNDNLSLQQMIEHCDEIRKVIKVESQMPHYSLLNCSFSQNIKAHIVALAAVNETIEGACRHCFGLYSEESSDETVANEMVFWDMLRSEFGIYLVFNEFLKRAWHLNPISKYFPNRYRRLVKSVRQAVLDKNKQEEMHYTDPYAQLKLLNETLKKLEYTLRHTSDPNQLAKVANSQVRVAGAIHIISSKLTDKHQQAIEVSRSDAIEFVEINENDTQQFSTEELAKKPPVQRKDRELEIASGEKVGKET